MAQFTPTYGDRGSVSCHRFDWFGLLTAGCQQACASLRMLQKLQWPETSVLSVEDRRALATLST